MLITRRALSIAAAAILYSRRSHAFVHGKNTALTIILNWDTSVTNSAPAGFKPEALAVANLFSTLIKTPATVQINVGFGEVGGIPVTAIGQSLYFLDSFTYTQIRNAYRSTNFGPDMNACAGQLPVADPTGGRTFWISQACAKALGLVGGSGLDGYVGFNSSTSFDYGGGPSISGVDFCGTFAHELAEVLGRYLLCDTMTGGAPSYNLLDLFRYSSAGVRNLGAGNTAGYFSIDGGVTNVNSFNTGGGDPGDWSGSGGADAFNANASSNVTQPVNAGDQRVMAACGWQTNGLITWDTSGF